MIWLEGVQDVLHRHKIKTSINKRAVQAKVMELRDAQVECQDRAIGGGRFAATFSRKQ